VDTAILPLEDPGLSTAVASVEEVALVEEGVSDEALVLGVAGADIPQVGADGMGTVMGPHTPALMPRIPRMS